MTPHARPRRPPASQPAVRRRGQFGIRVPLSSGFNWRWISGALALVLIGAGIFIFTSPLFRVTQAEIGGLQYVPAEEVFTASGVAGRHILMIDPTEVSEQVTASPSFDSVQVWIGWPARVVIVVREREPALVWEQGGNRYWVDVNGNLMVMRRDLPNLVRVINEGEAIPFQCPGPACTDENRVTIDPAVVLGTQQLKTLRPNIDVLYYDPVHGLSYQDGRGWRAYFGVGINMGLKLAIYETLVANLVSRGVQPIYIDVSDPDAPFYRVVR